MTFKGDPGEPGADAPAETPASVKVKYESNANTNAFTDAEKSKLAALESSHFKGVFETLDALKQAIPFAQYGNYAYVGAEDEDDVIYLWDVSDGKWVKGGNSTAETPASILSKLLQNPDTNQYTDFDRDIVSRVEDKTDYALFEAHKNNTSVHVTPGEKLDISKISTHVGGKITDATGAHGFRWTQYGLQVDNAGWKYIKPVIDIQTKSHNTSSWTVLSGQEPYTHRMQFTILAPIQDNLIELINDQPALFAKHGFAISNVNGNVITVWSIGKPVNSVSLTLWFWVN